MKMLSQGNDKPSPLFLATLASKGGVLSPDRPLSRTAPHSVREFKVLVVGSAGVGKTSLIRREAYNEFDQDTPLTMGTERHVTKIDIHDDQTELALYDTVGQERFRTLSTTMYRNSQAVLLCFDSSNRASFEAVDKWYVDVERNAPQDALILLVATKTDLPRAVLGNEGRQKAATMGVHFVETSAKTGHNVKAVFALVASALAGEKRLRAQSSVTSPPSPVLTSRALERIASRRESMIREEAAGTSKSAQNSRSGSPIRLTATPEAPVQTGFISTCWGSIASRERPRTPDSQPPHSPTPSILGKSELDPIPIPEDGLSLAEVVIEHASQRARNLAGGLRRRNTLEPQELTITSLGSSANIRRDTTLEPFWEDSNESLSVSEVASSASQAGVADQQSIKSPTLARVKSLSKPAYRECSLGCGAVLEEARTNHETDECWLRSVSCSLGCGCRFPMVDCLAHEREACSFRMIRCDCGSKVRADQMDAHTDSYKGQSVSLWSEVDVAHFITSIFSKKEQDRRLIDFAQIVERRITGRDLVSLESKSRLGELLRSDDVMKTVSTALLNYSFAPSSSSNASPAPKGPIEYVDWVDDFDPESKQAPHQAAPSNPMAKGAQMMFGLNAVSAQQRLQMLAPQVQAHAFRHLNGTGMPSPTPSPGPSQLMRVEELDAELKATSAVQIRDVASMWRAWHQEAIAWSTRSSSIVSSKGSNDADKDDQETTREVLVPLSLGSRTVAVRTIRFKDLKLTSQDLVGSGSFGSVYFGCYRGAQVAVKHLHCQDVAERDLLREAAVMTSVSGHPHVLRFLGVCLERPNVSFISEALQCSLEEWLRHDRMNRAEPLKEILRYAEEAASGLYHLHLEMVVHRDIAARNLLLDSGNPRRVKVCDFGLARVLPRRNAGGSNMISQVAFPAVGGSMNLSGPLRWMSPESLRPGSDGLTRFSFATDVYSFAVTVWELLSRDIPYPLLQPHESAIAVLMEDLRPPMAKLKPASASAITNLLSSQGGKCVVRLVALLERAWDKDPAKRPPMRELVAELASIRASCAST